MFFSAENVLTTDHPKVLRARSGILPEGAMRRIESLVGAAEAEHPDEELRQLLRNLVPDFHPHPAPGTVTPVGEPREVAVREVATLRLS
jgi:hypothetical protein